MDLVIFLIGVQSTLLFLLGFYTATFRVQAAKIKNEEKLKLLEIKLNNANRSHGNQAEFGPTICILFYLIKTLIPNYGSVLSGIMIALTVGRFLHCFGLLLNAKGFSRPRFIGASLTFSLGFLLSVIIILQSMNILPPIFLQ
jgi:uncharacterized membrane protein YecN with MAPEG domain